MADIDPLKIFFFIVRMAVAIFVVFGIGAIASLVTIQIKTDDAERFSLHVSDAIMKSNLTAAPYVFDRAKLDEWDSWSNIGIDIDMESGVATRSTRELPFLRSCLGYYAEIVSLNGNRLWKFGYKPSDSLEPGDVIRPSNRAYDVAIKVPNPEKPENFYETVNQARLSVTAYDTWFTRVTCAVEKAHDTKIVQNVAVPSCFSADPERAPCFSLRYVEDKEVACFFARTDAGEKDIECRYLPKEIKFENIYEDFQSLKDRGIDPNDDKTINFYPLKAPADCESVKQNTDAYVAGVNDNVQTVLICVEK